MENNTICRQFIQVWSLNLGIAVKANIVPALVIGHDQNDIGPLGFFLTGNQSGQGNEHEYDPIFHVVKILIKGIWA
jgi:hypothetical protein